MIRTTPINSPPQFCHACGSSLMDSEEEAPVEFDQFTGARMPTIGSLIRACPKWLSGLDHDQWSLDHGDSVWRLR